MGQRTGRLIYVSKKMPQKEFDADKMTGAIRQKADALMRSEVAAYDSYLRGECYGFELYKNGELSDSCWGFMGNFSDVLKDMAAYLPDECKGMVDHLEEQERPATIKTLLKHAKIQVDQAAKSSLNTLPDSRFLGKAGKSYFHIINTDFIRKEDALQEELEQRTVSVSIQAAKLSGRALRAAIAAVPKRWNRNAQCQKSRAQQHEAADL